MNKRNVMFVSQGLKPAPKGENWVLGWGAIRIAPWDLDSVFDLSIEAELRAHLLGESYRVQYGTHEIGTARFIPVTTSKQVLYPDLNGYRGSYNRVKSR